jgi:hypothetical protein
MTPFMPKPQIRPVRRAMPPSKNMRSKRARLLFSSISALPKRTRGPCGNDLIRVCAPRMRTQTLRTFSHSAHLWLRQMCRRVNQCGRPRSHCPRSCFGCTRQTTGNSGRPKIDVGNCRRRHRLSIGDVGKLQVAAGFEHGRISENARCLSAHRLMTPLRSQRRPNRPRRTAFQGYPHGTRRSITPLPSPSSETWSAFPRSYQRRRHGRSRLLYERR